VEIGNNDFHIRLNNLKIVRTLEDTSNIAFMNKTLIKILKISKGISQLFCAMDKGFRKVESDIELIREFRYLCYHANDNLESVHKELAHNIDEFIKDKTPPIDDVAAKVISNSLREIRFVLEENTTAIKKYIEDYSQVWKKTLSINALNKFSSLLEREYLLLNQEIDKFMMELVYQERVNIISQPEKTRVENQANNKTKS
jgi:hypothetical protein